MREDVTRQKKSSILFSRSLTPIGFNAPVSTYSRIVKPSLSSPVTPFIAPEASILAFSYDKVREVVDDGLLQIGYL